MKKSFLLFTLLSLTVLSFSQKRSWSLGLNYNYEDRRIATDTNSTTDKMDFFGHGLGVSFTYNILDQLTFNANLGYQNLDYYLSFLTMGQGVQPQGKIIRANYLKIPVNIGWSPMQSKFKIIPMIGFDFSYNLGYSEATRYTDWSETDNEIKGYSFNKSTLSTLINIKIQYSFADKVTLFATPYYIVGLSNFYTLGDENYKASGLGINAGLAWEFKE